MRPSDEIHSERGFTLLELLIVMLIIGVLAAIALPAFLGQRYKAQDSDAKENARNLVTQVEACFVEAQDYANCDQKGELPNTSLPLDTTFPPGAGQVSAQGQFTSFTVVAVSKSGNTFSMVHASNNVVDRTCSASASGGGCTNGTW